MNKSFESIKEGQVLVTKAGNTFQAVNPHVNEDESDHPFVVYDKDGNSYFEEDIDIDASLQGKLDTENERIVFAKFHIPASAKCVESAILCSEEDGKWGKPIPAEITIAMPDKIEYLPLNGDSMRELGHNFIDNMWRSGFNTCLELFMTGKLSGYPGEQGENPEPENNKESEEKDNA